MTTDKLKTGSVPDSTAGGQSKTKGLLIRGHIVPIPGHGDVASFDDTLWCRPPASETRTTWVRQYFLHKTIADDPEFIAGDVGPRDGDRETIDAWHRSGKPDGAHLITGYDGRTCCLADLSFTVTYHATRSNKWSVGHEMKEQPGGGVYRATIGAAVDACVVACRELGIQLQMPRLRSYKGHPMPRMANGGPDMVGIFGHRDNTEARGVWDPGEFVFNALAVLGVEQLDFAAGEDRDVWARRQRSIGMDTSDCDGVPGPKTVAALKTAGYVDGIWILGKQ